MRKGQIGGKTKGTCGNGKIIVCRTMRKPKNKHKIKVTYLERLLGNLEADRGHKK